MSAAPLSRETMPRYPARWRFWAALAVQSLLLLGIAFGKLDAWAAGTPATLQVAPFDPTDWLRGRYGALQYPMFSQQALRVLPGWRKDYDGLYSGHLYFTLAPSGPKAPWHPIAVANAYPQQVPAGDLVLRGDVNDGNLNFGIEEYYLADSQGDALVAALRSDKQGAIARIKIGRDGTAVLVGIEADGKSF